MPLDRTEQSICRTVYTSCSMDASYLLVSVRRYWYFVHEFRTNTDRTGMLFCWVSSRLASDCKAAQAVLSFQTRCRWSSFNGREPLREFIQRLRSRRTWSQSIRQRQECIYEDVVVPSKGCHKQAVQWLGEVQRIEATGDVSPWQHKRVLIRLKCKTHLQLTNQLDMHSSLCHHAETRWVVQKETLSWSTVTELHRASSDFAMLCKTLSNINNSHLAVSPLNLVNSLVER